MTDWHGSRAGNKIASMTVTVSSNFVEHSGTLVSYIPTDDDLKTIDDEVEKLRLLSSVDADVCMPDRTPVGTIQLMHSWARRLLRSRSKQKS